MRTTATADPGALVSLLSPRSPLAFLRGGDGIIGFGVARRLMFAGTPRIRDAALSWRAFASGVAVSDELRMPGTGLVAFGSFAFAEQSLADSVLVIPRVIIGRRDDLSWITTVDDATLPPVAPLGEAFAASFAAGDMTASSYVAAVEAAVARVGAGALKKVVVARDLVAGIPHDADLRLPLARLAAAYPDTFTFAVEGLIGSSPETLVSVAGRTVTARVLAGSAARGASQAADEAARAAIELSAKDQAEHDFARASVLSALASHTVSLSASDPFPLQLPNLWHLASDITGSLDDDSSSLDLVAALHPTAAVAGEPTDAALAAIAELEPFDRGRYAGPVGWVGANGDGEWAVALRCAQVSGSQVRAYAGAGIVAESVPSRELAETELKFRPIVEAFS